MGHIGQMSDIGQIGHTSHSCFHNDADKSELFHFPQQSTQSFLYILSVLNGFVGQTISNLAYRLTI